MICSRILKIFCNFKVFKSNFFSRRINKMHNLVAINNLQSKAVYSHPNNSFFIIPTNKFSINNETFISLILLNGKIISLKFKDAEILSAKKNSTLEKVEDSDIKTDNPLYKLIAKPVVIKKNDNDIQLQKFKKKSSSKLIMLSSTISSHDLQVKIKNMIRFLHGYRQVEVRIAKGNDSSRITEISESIIKALNEMSENYQKGENNSFLKLYFKPLKKYEQDQECKKNNGITQEEKNINETVAST